MDAGIALTVDGRRVEVPDDGTSLLDVLRDRLGVRSVKDGCSPQGQCGCCTVLVDGAPRVACVTPARRVAGRAVTTAEGLDPVARARWSEALCATGGSQCGFCTPGIVVRLAALVTLAAEGGRAGGAGRHGHAVRHDVAGHHGDAGRPDVAKALLAHLCRCTGWQTIEEAYELVVGDLPGDVLVARDLAAAAQRATLEGGAAQLVGPTICLGLGGFADDTAPQDALVAVRGADGAWVVAETFAEARAAAARVQGRRSTVPLTWPIELPRGEWARTLRTTWVEPGYLEPDASWCQPGGEPASALANGGAFGGKRASPLPEVARSLADRYGRPVRVLASREDVVRLGAEAATDRRGRACRRHGRAAGGSRAGIAEAIASVAPGLEVQEVDVAGPPTSTALRAAGWAEAAILLASLQPDGTVLAPNGATGERHDRCRRFGRGAGALRATARRGRPAVVLHRRRAHGARLGALGGHRGRRARRAGRSHHPVLRHPPGRRHPAHRRDDRAR